MPMTINTYWGQKKLERHDHKAKFKVGLHRSALKDVTTPYVKPTLLEKPFSGERCNKASQSSLNQFISSVSVDAKKGSSHQLKITCKT